MKQIETKVCIVGAGPAGATTSIFLGKAGIAHVLVDASAFPRDKVCGDGLDLNVVRVLNHINPQLVPTLLHDASRFAPSAGMRFILPNGTHTDIYQKTDTYKPGQPLFYVSKRQDFDAALLAQTNRRFADVHLQTRIETIERQAGKWHLKGQSAEGPISFIADMLVGADGDHSVVLRHVGARKIDRNHYAAAVRQYWQGIEGLHPQNLIEIYFPKSLPLSYFWIFPLPNGQANVGYGMASAYVAKKKLNVRKSFEELIQTDPLLKSRFRHAQPLETVKGWGVPMASSQRKAHGDGWLLVGDAASIVCPTSGEGIGSGMLSGYTAAKFIERAIEQNNFSELAFTNYDREIHKRLRMEEKVFNLVNRLPAWAFTLGINTVLKNKLFTKWVCHRELPKWLKTAYETPIAVTLD